MIKVILFFLLLPIIALGQKSRNSFSTEELRKLEMVNDIRKELRRDSSIPSDLLERLEKNKHIHYKKWSFRI